MMDLYSFAHVEKAVSLGIIEEDIATEEEMVKDILDSTPREVVEQLMEAQKVILSLTAYIKHLKEGDVKTNGD